MHELMRSPGADLVFSGEAPWGYDPATHTLRSPKHRAARPSPQLQDAITRYLAGVKLLVELDMATKPPAAITIEHDKRCQLGCSFCYAGSNKVTTSPRLDPKRVWQFVERYQTRDVHVYGGDPFFDVSYMTELLEGIAHRVGGIRKLHISTNALGLRPDVLLQLRSISEKLDLQVSCEPEFFGLRNTKGGVHQNGPLAERIAALPVDYALKFSTVLAPSAGVTNQTFIDGLMAYDTLAAGRPFSIVWMMETENKNAQMPPWVIRWIAENWMIHAENAIPTKFQNAMLGSAYMRYVKGWSNSQIHDALMGNLMGCGSGTGNFAFASDGHVYTCHEKAAAGVETFRVGTKNAWERWKASRQFFTPDYVRPECRACPAKFGCQLCSVKASNTTCSFEQERFALGVHLLYLLDNGSYMALADKLEDRYYRILEQREDIYRIVRSPYWDRLLSSTETVDDVQWCYSAAFGRPMKPLLEVTL